MLVVVPEQTCVHDLQQQVTAPHPCCPFAATLGVPRGLLSFTLVSLFLSKAGLSTGTTVTFQAGAALPLAAALSGAHTAPSGFSTQTWEMLSA